MVFSYTLDNGALGESTMMHSVVNSIDSNEIINKLSFSNLGKPTWAKIKPIKWNGNYELLVSVDPRSFHRYNQPLKINDIKLGSTNIKVQFEDITNGNPPLIEHFSKNKDGTKLLVAYRYQIKEGPSRLEISVINANSKIPIVGNIYSAFHLANPVLIAKWINNSTIEITNDKNELLGDYFKLNEGIQNIKVEINEIDFKSEYIGINEGWYNKPLYNIEEEELLFKSFFEVNGIITEIFSWGASSRNKLINIRYQYEVNGQLFSSYFRTKMPNEQYKIGDEIAIIVNDKQPLIHKTKEEYGR